MTLIRQFDIAYPEKFHTHPRYAELSQLTSDDYRYGEWPVFDCRSLETFGAIPGLLTKAQILPYGPYDERLIEPLVPNYGVADGVEQLLRRYGDILEASPRQFLLCATVIRREDQPKEQGWRWDKWGDYVGEKEPQCEYLVNEPDIDQVVLFNLYEIDSTKENCHCRYGQKFTDDDGFIICPLCGGNGNRPRLS